MIKILNPDQNYLKFIELVILNHPLNQVQGLRFQGLLSS
jgi:hypothetical protein